MFLSLALTLLLTSLMLFKIETKQQVMWACSLKTCGFLGTQDHFAAPSIVDPSLLASTFKEYSNVLESKMYQPAYATHNPMLFANSFTYQLEMLFMSF
jgi:hypothetical protein